MVGYHKTVTARVEQERQFVHPRRGNQDASRREAIKPKKAWLPG